MKNSKNTRMSILRANAHATDPLIYHIRSQTQQTKRGEQGRRAPAHTGAHVRKLVVIQGPRQQLTADPCLVVVTRRAHTARRVGRGRHRVLPTGLTRGVAGLSLEQPARARVACRRMHIETGIADTVPAESRPGARGRVRNAVPAVAHARHRHEFARRTLHTRSPACFRLVRPRIASGAVPHAPRRHHRPVRSRHARSARPVTRCLLESANHTRSAVCTPQPRLPAGWARHTEATQKGYQTHHAAKTTPPHTTHSSKKGV
eukprot:3448764-Rhodomonas_salina.2